MTTKLDQHDTAILRALDEQCGAVTGRVSVEVGITAPRSRNSQLILRRLRALELAGLVGRLDDQKPVAWTRTPAGTAAIAPAPQKEAAA